MDKVERVTFILSLIEFWSSVWFKKRSSSFVAPYMALFNMNALSVAMNAEQDVAVRALKLQLEEKQLALERAHMFIEDTRAHILREEDKDTSDDDEIRCIVCETVSSPNWFNIVPAGTLPEVTPETRIVCGSCYAANPAMGEVDSSF